MHQRKSQGKTHYIFAWKTAREEGKGKRGRVERRREEERYIKNMHRLLPKTGAASAAVTSGNAGCGGTSSTIINSHRHRFIMRKCMLVLLVVVFTCASVHLRGKCFSEVFVGALVELPKMLPLSLVANQLRVPLRHGDSRFCTTVPK